MLQQYVHLCMPLQYCSSGTGCASDCYAARLYQAHVWGDLRESSSGCQSLPCPFKSRPQSEKARQACYTIPCYVGSPRVPSRASEVRLGKSLASWSTVLPVPKLPSQSRRLSETRERSRPDPGPAGLQPGSPVSSEGLSCRLGLMT